jgi:hypothetical protein
MLANVGPGSYETGWAEGGSGMPVMVRSYNLPRWLGPLVGLAVLALIPFALMVALALAGLSLGVLVIRSLLPSSGREKRVLRGPGSSRSSQHLNSTHPSTQVLDAEYEVKETHEKEQ